MDWLKFLGGKKKGSEPGIQLEQVSGPPQDNFDDQEMAKLLDAFIRTCWPSNYGDHTLGVDTDALKALKGPYLAKAQATLLESLEKEPHVNSIIAVTAIEMTEAIPSMIRWIKRIRSMKDKGESSVAYGKLASSLYYFTKDEIYLKDLTEAVRISGFGDMTGSDAIHSLWKVPLTIEALSAVWDKLKRGKAIRESSSWRDNCEDFLREKLDDPVGRAFLKTLPETEQQEIQSTVATTKNQRIERNRRFEQYVVSRYDRGDLNKYGEYIKVGGSPVPGLTLRCILEGHTKEVNSTSWSPDGSFLASAGSDNLVVIWDVKKGEFISLVDGGTIDRSGLASGYDSDYRIAHVDWSADGKWIAFGSEKKNIGIWNVRKEAFLVPPKSTSTAVRNLAWAPGKNILLYSFDDNTVWIRDILSGEVRQIFQGYPGSFDALAWSSDAAFIAAGCWDRNRHSQTRSNIEEDTAEILLWDVKNETIVAPLSGHSRYISDLCWMPGKPILAASSADGTISIWKMQEKRQITSLKTHTSPVENVSFAAGGILLASTAETDDMIRGTVRLWRTDTWQELFILKELGSAEDTLAFHPTLPLLATRCHGNPQKNSWNSTASCIRIWDLDFETFLKNPPFMDEFNQMEVQISRQSI